MEGYRSIKERIELHLDPRVTVVLGPNDHGKTNLLEGLLHLNPDRPFDSDSDLNWDRVDQAGELPAMTFEIQLTAEEQDALRSIERLLRQRVSLEPGLSEAQANLSEVEKLATNARSTAEKAERALEAAQAESPEASPSEADDAESPKSSDDARDATLQATMNEAMAAEERVDAAKRALAAVDACMIQVDSGIREEPVDDAVDRAVAKAEAAATAAHQTLEAADEKAETARAAAEAGAAQHGEGSAAHQELVTAAGTATTARTNAARKEASARNKFARLSRAAEAVAAWRNGNTSEFPKPKDVAPAPVSQVPTSVTAQRIGLAGNLEILSARFAEEVFDAFIRRRLPRVRLIGPGRKIPDATNREQLKNADMAFMRGIFHYAGLAQKEWEHIFEQTDATTRRLEDASELLNEALRESWSQGSKLTFSLDHNSKSKKIELRIKDPAVTQQFVRASRRSSGFTHFFALKTILNAHQQEAQASSYIWVFDEPGIYLHPDGQHDLVQVMETLAQANQVVYSTHSIFMANKNFPTRHRLVVKKVSGSAIDGKPYKTRWRPAIEALGMSLPGTLLFASRVVLVEGDSDSILLNATLQKMIELGELERDVNGLAVMPAGDAADASALVRILRESEARPRIAALFDGDEGGRQRERSLARVDRGIEVKLLTHGTTIEDHVPGATALYPRALAAYVAKIMPQDDVDSPLTSDDLLKLIMARFDELECPKNGFPKGMAEWTRRVGREVAELDDKPSPVGVAREYALLLQDSSPEDMERGPALRRAREICRWIAETLELPPLVLPEADILAAEGFSRDELA